MKHEMEKDDLIQKFGIKEQIDTSFRAILKENTAEDLDIENKNLSINSRNIEYSKTELGFHIFNTQILDEKNKAIGYIALIVTNTNERIDEYFVIEQ